MCAHTVDACVQRDTPYIAGFNHSAATFHPYLHSLFIFLCHTALPPAVHFVGKHAPVHMCILLGCCTSKLTVLSRQDGPRSSSIKSFLTSVWPTSLSLSLAEFRNPGPAFHRGIDFKGVRTVLNVDVPSSVAGYVHRVGRTGRAGEAGTAISLLSPEDAVFTAMLQRQLDGACSA